MGKSICTQCEHFYGYDGITEIWTGCNLIGDFKGVKEDCKHWKSKNEPKKRFIKLFQRWFNSREYFCDCMGQPVIIRDEDIDDFLKEFRIL